MSEMDSRNGAELTREEREFAARAGERLRISADELDAAALSQLNRARQAALKELPGSAAGGPWLLPAGVMALVALLVVGLWRIAGPNADSAGNEFVLVPVTSEQIGDLEILLEVDDLAMLDELEFFAWLTTLNPEVAG